VPTFQQETLIEPLRFIMVIFVYCPEDSSAAETSAHFHIR